MDEKRKLKEKLHARDKLFYEENEAYYLNRYSEKGTTEGMVYYKQRVDGKIVKTEITLEQWKALYRYNKQAYRKDLKYYDDRYFSRFSCEEDEDPMECQADFETRFIEGDVCERLDMEQFKKGLSTEQQKLYHYFFEQHLSQQEIGEILHIEQFQVSRKTV